MIPNSNPFFSVVIPTYNRADKLMTAVHSVINQKFTDWEIIIVDDGSTDNTKERIEGIANDRIKYLFQENKERSAARNAGIDHSSGKYICFLDSDDLYLPDHLVVLHEYIAKQNFPIGLFYTDYHVNESGKVNALSDPPITGLKPASFMLKKNILPSRICVHRDILNHFKFDEKIVVVEDTDLWVRIVSYYPFYHIPECTVEYFLHENSSVNIKKFNAFRSRLEGLNKLFNKPEGREIPEYLKREEISNCYFGIAKYYSLQKDKIRYIQNLLISIFKNPGGIRTKHKIFLILLEIPFFKTGWIFFHKRNQ